MTEVLPNPHVATNNAREQAYQEGQRALLERARKAMKEESRIAERVSRWPKDLQALYKQLTRGLH
jgi:hypothetical protein